MRSGFVFCLKRIFVPSVLSMMTSFMGADAFAQKLYADWNASVEGVYSASGISPFWTQAGRRGLFPQTNGALMIAGGNIAYSTSAGVNLYSGLSLAGLAEVSDWKAVPDELFLGVGWKMLRLDVGMKSREYLFDGMSLTGGNITYSSNSRNLPGVNLHTDYIYLPARKKVFGFKFSYGNYLMEDNRYVQHTKLLERSLNVKFALHERVDLILELELWSQWGGISPDYGSQPHTFNDYVRVFFCMSGGSDATLSDQINVLGNHLGRELIKVDWRADKFKMSFMHDIPFDDGSGMGLQNFPDGVNTVMCSFNNRKGWVTDLIYEFVFTKWQSGEVHDRPVKDDEVPNMPNGHILIGGCDNYFNNSCYLSGWTYYGRTIGLPLFTPMPAGDDGIVLGVSNNRVAAHHFGIGGMIASRFPYRFLFTYSRNFGCYSQRLAVFDSVPEQFSVALKGEWPCISKHFPISVGLGLYADFGKVLPDSFGVTLRFSYSGSGISFRK